MVSALVLKHPQEALGDRGWKNPERKQFCLGLLLANKVERGLESPAPGRRMGGGGGQSARAPEENFRGG